MNRTFLKDIGVTLSDEEFLRFNAQYEAELDKRVVNEIVDGLTNEQLRELGRYKHGPEDALQQWLVNNVPNLTTIVEQETAILLGEIAENSDGFTGT